MVDMIPGGPDVGKDRHTSQRQFSIEKGEHLTAVLPSRDFSRADAGPRDPQEFRHKSCDGLAKEKAAHKTVLYPEVPKGASVRGSGVIDNFLNVRPHAADFLHTSHGTFSREKMGHLTAIHTSPTRRAAKAAPAEAEASEGAAAPAAPPSRPPSESLADFPEDVPHRSVEKFSQKKCRHATSIHNSPPRGGAAPRSAGRKSSGARSPAGGYQSRELFTEKKRLHMTPINPVSSPGQAPAATPDGTPSRSPDRGGYNSFVSFSMDKRRHVADVDRRARPSDSKSPGRGPSASASPQHSRMPPPDEVHRSHNDFSENKARHATEIRSSPPRKARFSSGQANTPSPGPTYSSLKELQRAKRGHQACLGSASPAPKNSPSPEVHQSYRGFAEEKHRHSTGIQAVSPPQMKSPAPEPSPARVSYRQFTAEKSKHRADIQPSPQRRPSVGGSVQRSPEYMRSHQHFSLEKSKHSYEMDSPRRAARAPPTPAQPPSEQRTPSRYSDQTPPM